MFKVESSFLAVGEQVLANLGGLENWMRLSVEDKLLQFTSFLANMRKDLRLGGLVGVYIVFKNNMSQVSEDIKSVIIEEIFTTLSEYENQEHVFMVSALEIIGLIGPNERTYSRMGVLKALMSKGLGFFLSRPIVQGPIKAGSACPSGVISTAQPSSSSFLMTRAVQPFCDHSRGSWMTASSSGVPSGKLFGVFIG